MATKPHAWPTNAAEARDRASEEANRGLKMLVPLLDGGQTESEKVRRLAIAINSLQTIARLLEGVGAQTRP
jgi:hypothetical protein